MVANNFFAHCAKCGRYERKREMRPLYTAIMSSLPPHLLCYLCELCYCNLLDELEIDEK